MDESAYYLAVLALIQGRVSEFNKRMAKFIDRDEKSGAANAALQNTLLTVSMERAYAGQAKAASSLRLALARFPVEKMEQAERPYWLVAEVSAELGDTAFARRYSSIAAAQHVRPPVDEYYGRRARLTGLLAMAEGKPDQAAISFEAASKVGQCTPCVLPDIARAREAAGQVNAAITAYERYVAVPYDEKLELGIVYERLVDLYARGSNRQKAALYATRLTELWNNADPPLKLRAAAARASLAR
jgi:hypothetical protein